MLLIVSKNGIGNVISGYFSVGIPFQPAQDSARLGYRDTSRLDSNLFVSLLIVNEVQHKNDDTEPEEIILVVFLFLVE